MFLNFLKVAFRKMQKQKGYAFINVAGLAVGLTISALILMWVVDELSFDRFHENSDRIHRVYVDLTAGSHMILALSMPELAGTLINEYPEVTNAVRISRPGRASVKFREKEFYENYVCYADPSLFQVFSFSLIKGNVKSVLAAPYTAVITESMANKYFSGEDPLGKIITINGIEEYAVTGIVRDAPANSHFQFHIVCSFETLYSKSRDDMQNWLNIQYYTYLLLAEGIDAPAVEDKLPATIDKYLGPTLKSMGGSLVLHLQPLVGIHLHSKIGGDIAAQGDITYVYLFSCIAFFILILACINFINLATARSSSRSLEIGMRKTLGSSRKHLIFQFLGESLIYSFTAFLLAVAAIELLKPLFESLIGRPLNINIFHSLVFLLGFTGLALAAGILSGMYPAFYLSSFRTAQVLKNSYAGGRSRSWSRNMLVVFQFSVSILLMIGTITVHQQINFMKNKDLGFEAEHVLVIPQVQGLLARISFQTVRDEFLRIPGIKNVAGSSLVPTQGVQNALFYPEGFTREQPQKLTRLDIEPNYLETMSMEIIFGRNFSKEMKTDQDESVLINQTTANMFGWTEPLGKTFTFWPRAGDNEKMVTRKVVGVVRDFHFTSLHRKIEPVVLVDNPGLIRFLSLRIDPENIPRTVTAIQKKWEQLEPQRPFDYFFLDASFDSQYKEEERIGSLSLYFSLLAVFLGCLGLFGLAAFMAERRTKEIGIRKVLGASTYKIVRLISREFLILVVVANILAWPAAYVGMNIWLQNFPYRVYVSVLVMLTAGFAALVTSLLTVSYQALKAAVTDPVNTLRYE